MRQGKFIGHLGGFIGVMGWTIGLFIVGLFSNALDILVRPLAIGVLINLSFFLVLVSLVELLEKDKRNDLRLFAIYGVTGLFVGVMTLLFNYWIAPIIDQTPELCNTMNRLGGVYRVSDSFGVPWLLIGGICLGIVFKKILE